MSEFFYYFPPADIRICGRVMGCGAPFFLDSSGGSFLVFFFRSGSGSGGPSRSLQRLEDYMYVYVWEFVFQPD